jgi:prophage regulatory protein
MNHVRSKIIRRPAVIALLGMSKTTLYNRIQAKTLPPPISLGARAVGFVLSEYYVVLNAIIAEKSQDEIKALVASLVQERQKEFRG